MTANSPIVPTLRLIGVIDGTNLKGVLDQKSISTHVNYRQLLIELGKRLPKELRWRLERVVYVTASPIQSHDHARFERWREFEAMLRRQERVELKLGRLEGPRDRIYEKGVDILVAIELLAGAFRDQYDIAILISGDGDFADVARVVREAGKRLYNAFFELHKSYELSREATGFIDLDTIPWDRIKVLKAPPGGWRRF